MDTAWDDDEIVAYAIGSLSDGDRRRVEALAREDATLDATLAVMGALLGDSATPDAGPPMRRTKFRRGIAVAALALMGVATYYTCSQAATQTARLRGMERIVSAAEPTDGSLQTIAFLPGTAKAEAVSPAPGRAVVEVRNATFGCKMTWSVGGESTKAEIPTEGIRLVVPSGRVRLTIEPIHLHAWSQPFATVRHRRGADEPKHLGSALGAILLDVADGDTIHVRLDQPFAPWNAAMVRFRGAWMLVTAERPWAEYDLATYRAGKYIGDPEHPERLPNTPLFWAATGSKGMARELVESFVAHRGDGTRRWGRVRGTMHATLIVPAETDRVAAPFQDATAAELVPVLTEAFEILRGQSPPVGPSMQEEIDGASRLRDEGLLPR